MRTSSLCLVEMTSIVPPIECNFDCGWSEGRRGVVGGSTLRNDGKSLSFSIEQPKMIVGEWRYLRIARHGETHFFDFLAQVVSKCYRRWSGNEKPTHQTLKWKKNKIKTFMMKCKIIFTSHVALSRERNRTQRGRMCSKGCHPIRWRFFFFFSAFVTNRQK